MAKLTDEESAALLYDWTFWARPNQLPPTTDWYIWLLLSGRGYGKTRALTELVRSWAYAGYSPIALVGQTKADVRDTIVELGESSILKVSPPWFMPEYEPSKRRLTWPNGTQAIIYSGDEPDQLRGPQHAKAAVDELAKYLYPQQTWDNLMMGLRVGDNPQAVIATTPRPIKILKDLVHQASIDNSKVVVTRGHTLDNRENLAPTFLRYILDRYEGTRLGRQELAGETLGDNPDALWKREEIDLHRVFTPPDLFTVVTAIDPAVSNKETSDETGIITAGVGYVKGKIHGYILSDSSLRASPHDWGMAALSDYRKFKADRAVAEVNNGGDMVESNIKVLDNKVSVTKVHATRGKYSRAEPVSALYEQGRVHHVGFFPDLEDQLCEWVPGERSPDRLDALVWALTEIMLIEEEHEEVVVYDAMRLVKGIDL